MWGVMAGEEVDKPQKRGWDAGFRAGRRSVWGRKSGTEGWKEQGAPFGNEISSEGPVETGAVAARWGGRQGHWGCWVSGTGGGFAATRARRPDLPPTSVQPALRL